MRKVRTVQDLKELVDSFREHAKRKGWDKPELASGSCDLAAKAFRSFATNAVIETVVLNLNDPIDVLKLAHHLRMDDVKLHDQLVEHTKELKADGMEECNVHEYSIITLADDVRVAVDWTARQYDPHQPFPLFTVEDDET